MQTNQKKIMISQPMSGRSEEEILETKQKAETFLRKLGYEVVDTYFVDKWCDPDRMTARGVRNIPLCFLARSLEKMSECDAVFFCKGWKQTRGCRVEYEAAEAYGLEVVFEPDSYN